jgi:hypothetical protein
MAVMAFTPHTAMMPAFPGPTICLREDKME